MSVKFGKTAEEKLALESLESRKIVKTIMDYGVSQKQLLQICKLLCMELEDNNAMKRISALVDEILENNSQIENSIIV
jgi:hypothetical protein